VGAVALRLLTVALALGGAAAALAHDVEAPAGTPALPWSFEPWVIVCLAVSGGAYAFGLRRLWRHADTGRGVTPLRAAAFAGGWLVLAAALVSPLDALGGRLFSAHMVQHELMMVVAAPMLVLAHPLAAWAWAMPPRWRRGTGAFFHHPAWRRPWKRLTAPLSAWTAHAAMLWGWHLPSWFDAALANDAMHALQHASFLFSALLFWWSVLGPARRAARGVAVISVFTTLLYTGALGALLTLSPSLWYVPYASTTAAFGIAPLEDQQLGGLVMWAPAGLAYFVAGLVLAARWIGPVEAAVRSARRGFLGGRRRHP
jgi:cytochrome c oxidase assembly factor CtaG